MQLDEDGASYTHLLGMVGFSTSFDQLGRDVYNASILVL